MRVVLNHKLILAKGLTQKQADKLGGEIRARPTLKTVYDNLFITNDPDGTYYVYLIDERAKTFVLDPDSFIFEV